MVTGATGYVGGVLVEQLLAAGLTVHCPVRDPANEAKVRHLRDLRGGERLKFFRADLLEQGSYLDSMKGCSVCFHLASPFVMDVPKGQEQAVLLDPAIKGALNVLESASDPAVESTMKRVVLTSSIAAIATDGADCEEAQQRTGKLCDEDTWNASATIDYGPYAYSKTLAEKAAWGFVQERAVGYALAMCHPAFIMGPGVKVHTSSESYAFAKKLGDGTFEAGCPDQGMAIVDVRDVARGHVAAGFLPAATVAGQRYILNGANTSPLDMSRTLAEAHPDLPLARSLLSLPASRHVGRNRWFDNAKSLRDLELGEYTPLKTTLHDMFKQCVDEGFIPPAETKD